MFTTPAVVVCEMVSCCELTISAAALEACCLELFAFELYVLSTIFMALRCASFSQRLRTKFANSFLLF